MHYSVDLRKKVIGYLDTHTIPETAKVFGISPSAISAWKRLLKETGSLRPAPLIRNSRKIDYNKLGKYVEANPDKYLREIAEVFGVSA